MLALAAAFEARGADRAAVAQAAGCEAEAVGALVSLLRPQLEKRAADEARSVAEGGRGGEHGEVGPSAPRLARIEAMAAGRQRGLFVVLERPGNPGNMAAAMRCCDAHGVTELLLIDSAVRPDDPCLRRASASASLWVDAREFATVDECAAYLASRGAVSAGTTVHSGRAAPLAEAELGRYGGGLALWFGNEVTGLTPAACDACPVHVYLPMRGIVESLNLAVTVGIMLAEATRQRSCAPGGVPTLDSAAQQAIVRRALGDA